MEELPYSFQWRRIRFHLCCMRGMALSLTPKERRRLLFGPSTAYFCHVLQELGQGYLLLYRDIEICLVTSSTNNHRAME